MSENSKLDGYYTPPWSTEITRRHVALGVIDMQKFFISTPNSPWKNEKALSIVPNIKALIGACTRGNTIFTSFKPPTDWQGEDGSWKNYYHHSIGVTADHMNPQQYQVIDDFSDDVVSPLTDNIYKETASAFSSEEFVESLIWRGTTFLVLCGIETDYCVLATALDAASRGYCVVIVLDACGSSKTTGQDDAGAIFKRFGGQVWVTDTKTITAQLAQG